MAEHVDNVDNATGNTGTVARQHRNWCFTLNNPTLDDIDRVLGGLKAHAKRFVFSKEIGESGTPHLQGYAEFKNARRMQGVKDIISQQCHLEVARGSAAQNYDYCTKKIVGGLKWEHGWPTRVTDPITVPRPFQAEIINTYDLHPNRRDIHWYWDATGNTGKTALAKHLVMKGETIYVNGKGADVKCAVSQWVKEGKPLKCVIFGIPRTCTAEYVSYSALEEVKDGIFFSGKYESGMVLMESPHVFVFANFPPDTSKLSADRWVIKEIGAEPFHNASFPIAAGAGGATLLAPI